MDMYSLSTAAALLVHCTVTAGSTQRTCTLLLPLKSHGAEVQASWRSATPHSRLLPRVAPERGVLGMGRYVLTVVLAQVLLSAAASLVSSVSSSLKSRGDGPVVTMALCGAGRSSVVGEALGVEGSSTCTLVSAPTPLALLDVPSAESADGTTAAVVADVLSLEVRFTDLVERTAHGLRQLLPLLQRSVRLRDVRPQPKLLLLTVTDFDASAVSESDVSAFVASQIEALVSSLALPAEEPVLTSADLLQLQCFFLPSKVHAPDAYDTALASLRDALVADSSSGYLLGDSRWMQPASNVVANVGQAAERAPAAPQARTIVTTAHTRTAHSLACSLPVFAVFLGPRSPFRPTGAHARLRACLRRRRRRRRCTLHTSAVCSRRPPRASSRRARAR